MAKKTYLSKVSPEFKKLMMEIQIEFLKNGKRKPSEREITDLIAKKINKDKIKVVLYEKIFTI